MAKLGPLAEPNEAMATQALTEKWFTSKKVRSEELPIGDGCDPQEKDWRVRAQLIEAQVSSNRDVRCQHIGRWGRIQS